MLVCRRLIVSLSLVFISLLSEKLLAYPDMTNSVQLDGYTLTRDRESESVFYLLPERVQLQKMNDGGPHFSLINTQYVGSRVREDTGEFKIFSTLRARLELVDVSQEIKAQLLTKLQVQYGRKSKIKSFPFSEIDAQLVYAADQTVELSQGYDESVDIKKRWTQRDLVLQFDSAAAEILERQLLDGGLGMSIGYTLKTKGWNNHIGVADTSASMGLSEQELIDLEESIAPESIDQEPQDIVVMADAIVVRIASDLVASRIKRIQLDGSLPASYPSLSVYFFDFKNDERDDLYRREVQIEAEGLNGGVTKYSAIFKASQPSEYAATVRFPYAVNLTRPFRWRSFDVLKTGEMQHGEWQTSDDWTGTVDASGPIQFERSAQSTGAISQ